MPIKDQAPELKKLSDDLNTEIFGETIQSAEDKGTCIACKLPALPRCYSDAGRREYGISGMCELCFDKMFDEDEDDLIQTF
jgi:hypothetical protein